MKLILEISAKEISFLKEFISKQDDSFMEYRRIKNVERTNILLDIDTIIRGITMCLLTTQQRSGPDTPISNFLNLRPFPFTKSSISKTDHPQKFVAEVLASYNLTRFSQKIPEYLVQNINTLLMPNEWELFQVKLHDLQQNNGKELERITADQVQDKLIGLGPKQARNLLQFLGLTQYEIPIDSRIAKWLLVDFGFPFPITPKVLQDRQYYHFIMDQIQVLCERTDILPCMFDAAVFSSMDSSQWSIERIPY